MNFTEKIEEILQKEAQAILDIPVTDLHGRNRKPQFQIVTANCQYRNRTNKGRLPHSHGGIRYNGRSCRPYQRRMERGALPVRRERTSEKVTKYST